MRKAISPVIAAVMIIAITLAVGVFIAIWASQLVRTEAEAAVTTTRFECAVVGLAASDAKWANNVLSFNLENTGTADLTINDVRIIYTNGSSVFADRTATGLPLLLAAGDKLPLAVSNTTDGPPARDIGSVRVLTDCPNANIEIGRDEIAIGGVYKTYTLSWNTTADWNTNGSHYNTTAGSLILADNELVADANTVLLMHLNNNSAIGENATLAVDESGYGNDGMINGSMWTTDSKFGAAALDFDGVDDYVNVGNDSSLNPAQITIEAWVKLDSWTSDYHVIVDKDNWDPYTLYFYNDTTYPEGVWFDVYRTDNSRCEAGVNNVIETGKWYHVAGTYNGSDAKIYLNGILVASAGCTVADIKTTPKTVYIGDSPFNAPGFSFNGIIDEVRILNRSLSAEEIAEDASSLKRTGYYLSNTTTTVGPIVNITPSWASTENVPAEYTADANSVLLMHLNNNSAIGENTTYAVDESSYGNNGTISGAIWNCTNYKFGGCALSFDGVDNQIYVGSKPSLDFSGTNSFTMEAWIKPRAADASLCLFVIDDRQKLMCFGPTKKMWGGVYTNAWYNVEGATVLSLGQWYHVAVVYDGSTLKIYLNGKLDGSISATGAISYGAADHDLYIGRFTGGQYFNGTIDEVRISNVSRTAAELRQTYETRLAYLDISANNGSSWITAANSTTYTSGAGIGTDNELVFKAGLSSGRWNGTNYAPSGVTLDQTPYLHWLTLNFTVLE